MTKQGFLKLYPVGDVELWFMQGQDWKLPFFVEWKTPGDERIYGVLRPALSLYPSQLLTVQNLLKGHALEDRSDRWILPKDKVRSMLLKAEGITPEFNYQWPQDGHPAVAAPSPVMTASNNVTVSNSRAGNIKQFAEYIHRCRGIPVDTALVVLQSICHLGPQWMLQSLQPLDFGFVRLVALPYRTNWKEIVAFKCKQNQLPKIFRLGPEKCKPVLSSIGFQGVVTSPHNVGLAGFREGNKLRRLHWTIEAIPMQPFEAMANEADRARMLNGHASYVSFYEQTIEANYNDIVAAMAHYLHKASSPWSEVRAISKTGLMAFLPISRHRAKVRGLRLDELPQHIAPPDTNFSVFSDGQSDPVLLRSQAAQMLKVPNLQSQVADVRDCKKRGDMGQFRPKGTCRVPVLDAGQSVDSGEPVLPCDSTG